MDPDALGARLDAPEVLVLPGVHDPLSALVLTQMGAEAAYVGGAAFSYGQLAAPDLNLASPDAMAEHVRRVRDVTALPFVVDADTGFGDVLNVERTVRQYVQAGATGVQLEDQTHPTRWPACCSPPDAYSSSTTSCSSLARMRGRRTGSTSRSGGRSSSSDSARTWSSWSPLSQ